MQYIKSILSSWASLIPRLTITDIIEIAIIAFLVYHLLVWFRESRAWSLLRGIIVIIAFTVLAAIFHLDTILWILGKIATIAVTALIVIFQPELRKALEQLGSNNIFMSMFSPSDRISDGFSEKTVNELCKASSELASTHTGALIVIEQNAPLTEIEKTGIEISGIVSSQLLVNIFEHNTPLHDGAIVIRGNIITAATCYLPLSDDRSISKALGTRHRAAIGISEKTDALTIVVSEETGGISITRAGNIYRMKDIDELRSELQKLIPESTQERRFKIWKKAQKK